MKKLPSTLLCMVLSLGGVTAVAGALLGVVYVWTKAPIAQQQAEAQVKAIRDVAPQFDNNPEADSAEVTVDGANYTVYPAKMGDKLVGAAVKASSMNGFSGEITVMCGFDLDGTVRNYTVLQQAETPGLGAKMQEWFRDPSGARSVIGKNPGQTPFYVTKDEAMHGTVDGITAATISSRAFLDCMRAAYEAYRDYAWNNGEIKVAPLAGEAAEASSGASHQAGAKDSGKVAEQSEKCDTVHVSSDATAQHENGESHKGRKGKFQKGRHNKLTR